MILPDVNVLVYSYREEAPHHETYRSWLDAMLVSAEEIALTEIVLIGFFRIVTSPRVFAIPAPASSALEFVDRLRNSPRARAVTATAATWKRFADLARGDHQIRANLVPDAWLAAIALSHGSRVATADRGFSRYPGLGLVDPLVAT